MVLIVTEKEMLYRFVDGLRKSSDRATEIMRAPEPDKPRLFTEFLNGMKVAAGSAHQLAHSRPDQSPEWLKLRDLLENVLEAGQSVPLMTNKQNGLWFNIKQSLEMLVRKGQQVAVSRGMSREDVLFQLGQRLENLPQVQDQLNQNG